MKHFLPCLFALAVSGCWISTPNSHMPMGASPLVVWGAGETVSVLATGKTMEDHLFSAITHKNCSIGRLFKGEGKFCMTDLEIEEENKPRYSLERVYCYSSIAAPTCYLTPSANATDRLIGIYDRPVYPVGR